MTRIIRKAVSLLLVLCLMTTLLGNVAMTGYAEEPETGQETRNVTEAVTETETAMETTEPNPAPESTEAEPAALETEPAALETEIAAPETEPAAPETPTAETAEEPCQEEPTPEQTEAGEPNPEPPAVEVYDAATDTILIGNSYQLDVLNRPDRAEQPVLSGDLDCASFGTGTVYYDGEGKLVTYGESHSYRYLEGFEQKADPPSRLILARMTANQNRTDGRDYFGQPAVTLDGTDYILLGSKAQLKALNSDSDPVVYGPVYEVFQRRNSLLNWDENNIVEETATLVYPGDADLIGGVDLGDGTTWDFTNEPLYDGNNGILSSDRYHSMTLIPDITGRTRTIYCTVDPATGEYSISHRTNPYSSLRYTKDAKYIVFRDISLDGEQWSPLMFRGEMYGMRSENSADVGTLWPDGTLSVDTARKPTISDFNVTVNNPINLNQYTGIGFFGTLQGTFNDSALIGDKVIVRNLRLADGTVANNAVRTQVDTTVVNALLTGLGAIVGTVLDGLLYLLTGGRIVGVRDMLTGLLNARVKDPTSLATGAFAGRIVGDAEVADCVVDNVSVSSVRTNFEDAANAKLVGTGGFVGFAQSETQYEGLSGLLGALTTVLSTLLNVIPGLGLGDLITLLLENTLPVGQLIPVGVAKPVIERCEVVNLDSFSVEDGKLGVGGFAGNLCGTYVRDCAVIDSEYEIKAAEFGGGFCGVARDAVIEGTLSGLGIDVLASLHPQTELIECEIRNTEFSVTGGARLGGFVGTLANSYAINDTIDAASSVTVEGSGDHVGGFCGFATLGTLFTLSDYLERSESLLSTVKGLVTGLLSDDGSQNLLDLGGVAASGIMGVQIDAPVTVSGQSYVGGLLGRGNGVKIMDSTPEHLLLLKRYERDGTPPDVETRTVRITNLVSVSAEEDYAGGMAGYLTTANVGGLLGDTLGIGQFLPFEVMNVEVIGADGGYTVTAGNDDAGGGIGFALGGSVSHVNLHELAAVDANNRAGGFVGTTGPGNLLGGGGLDLQLLGLHLVQIDSLLSIAQGVRTTFSECSATGVAAGYEVTAGGDNGVDGQARYCAGGFAGFASSADMRDCHSYNLHSVEANMDDAAGGGFVGLSVTGGLAGVLPEETTTLNAVKVGQLVNAVPYLVPAYNGCDVHFINSGYVRSWSAGGFAGDFQSGKVNKDTAYGYDCGTSEVPWAVYDVHHVRGGRYAGGFAGKAHAGALADAGGGLSILGGLSSVSISADQILGVAEVYVPMIQYAGVNAPDGFSVFAAESGSANAPASSGYAGGYVGYGCGVQISYCDVYRLKTGTVTEPDELEGKDGSAYMRFDTDPDAIPYAVAGGKYAGGYVGHLDIGSAASVGDGLKLLGSGIQLTNVLSALSVVVSTIEHSNVTGCPGGFSVIASSRVNLGDGAYDPSGVAYAGGYAGKVSGAHLQDCNCWNFYYVIGEIAAGGYVGEIEPGSAAEILNEGTISLLGNVNSLASLVEDFVPTVRNSETTSVPCGGCIRAQCFSDSLTKRGMAGGYAGHVIGAQIWGYSTDLWKNQNPYTGTQRECAAVRIRSVYGAEYAGGFIGLMEPGSTAQTGGLSLLGGLISADNLLGALQAVYSTVRNCAVYGPLSKMDLATWNAWVRYVGVYGGFASELARNGTKTTQEELDAVLARYVYGTHVVAGRDEFDNSPNIILGACAGGFVGSMHSGVIRSSHAEDVKLVRAMRSAGGFVGEMQTKGLAEFGQVGLLGLDLNLGNLISAGNVFVPALYDSTVNGYQKGLTVEAFGDKANGCGTAGGYAGASYGGQLDGGVVNKLLNVFGRSTIGGYIGKASSASVLNANTNEASNGFLQALLDKVAGTPNDLVDVLQATVCTIKNAEVHPADASYGIVVDGAYPGGIADYAGGFAGSLEATVVGERRNANDRIIVDGLHVVNGGYYAGGFFGIADVGSVADVGGGEGTTVLDLIQAGNVSLLDAFRTYVYHAEVNGIPNGSAVYANSFAATGIMHTYSESGGAGGFGGGMMNGTVEHSHVTNLRYVQAPNYAAGFVGYLGKNGGVTVDKLKITDDTLVGKLLAALGLDLGAQAQLLNIVGSTATDCTAAGWSKGFSVKTTRAQAPIPGVVDESALPGSAAAGFAGYADISQIASCHVTNLKLVESPQLAAGFVGRTSVSYILDTEISSDLTEVVVRLVNALIRLLYLNKLQDIDLINLDSALLGLHLLSDGDVLAVNLVGLKIAVSLSKNDEEYGGNQDAAIITLGSSTIKLPCDENGLTGETSNISITLIEGNRTCIKNSTVTGINDGYDVFGGDSDSCTNGTDDYGYAGAFVAVNDNGFLSHDEAILCDTVKGTPGKVGPFIAKSVASSRPLSYLEGTDNHFNLYRPFANGGVQIETAGGMPFAGAVYDDGTGTEYSRYRVLHRDVISSAGDLEGAMERGTETLALNAFVSPAKLVLMSDVGVSADTGDEYEPFVPVNLVDPCEEFFDLTVRKFWRGDKGRNRPETITVTVWQVAVGNEPPEQLIAEGRPDAEAVTVYTLTLTEADKLLWTPLWQKTLTGLPISEKVGEDLVYYQYFVEESPVSGYTSNCVISQETASVTFINEPVQLPTLVTDLPITGGRGFSPLPFALMLCAAAAFVLAWKRKREQQQ